MTTTTATDRNTPSMAHVPSEDTNPTGDPKNVRTMKKHEIIAELIVHFPDMNRTYANQTAYKIKRLLARPEIDWFTALRILGMQSDPTPLAAEHHISCHNDECDTCGRTQRRAA